MKNKNVISIPADFKIHLSTFVHKQVSEKLKLHIEEIWKKELIRTKGKVFNGELLIADAFDGISLRGHFAEYKYYLAQARDASLSSELQIKPICVCGYTTAGNYILIGKRSDHVTDFQNFFELVPAGGIDRSAVKNDSVDIIQQLKVELKEEAGIEASMVQKITPSFIIFFPENQLYEICAKIELDSSAKNRIAERDDEYSELIWIPKSEIQEFVKKHHQQIIPLSLQIIDLFC